MSREFDAIVVGGGLAGLTCAAYLCKYGIRTLLIEKNNKTGGLVSTFWHQGFAFDAGIRAFENSGVLFPMLKNLGIDMEFTENTVSIGIETEMVNLGSRDSLQSYATMLMSLFPNNVREISDIMDRIKKVMGYMDVIYGIENPLFQENIRDLGYITTTLLPWLVRYQVNISKAGRLNAPIYSYLRQLTNNEALVDMIAQHFFKDTPTFFALSYFGLYLDYCYPQGGTGLLAEKISELIKSSGGEVLTGTAVTHINANKRRIDLSDGQVFQYKKLVWAADQKMLYSITTGLLTQAFERQRELISNSSGGDSILTLYLGVNIHKDYFGRRCGAHAFYTPSKQGLSSLREWQESAKGGIDELFAWVDFYLERTTYEISSPVLRDESLAPDGKTGVIISTLLDYSLVRFFSDNGEYSVFKEHCIKKITDIFENSLFPGLREKVLFSICATPLSIERETGNKEGAITGWAFVNSRMPAENRFQKITNAIQTPINDILQCGQWTFSPSGLPVSILTGKLAADMVQKRLRGAKK